MTLNPSEPEPPRAGVNPPMPWGWLGFCLLSALVGIVLGYIVNL